MHLLNFWPFIPWKRLHPIALDLFVGEPASYIGNILYNCKKMHEIGTPFVCSKFDWLKTYKNVPRYNKFPLNNSGYLDCDAGEEFLNIYGRTLKERLVEILDENNLEKIYGYCKADSFSSRVTLWLLSELKSEGFIKDALLHLILPNANEGTQQHENVLDALKNTAVHIENKNIDSVVLLKNEVHGRNAKNSKGVPDISRCLEIIKKSFLIHPSSPIPDFFYSKNQILTYSYGCKKYPKKNDLIHEHVEAMTTLAIIQNFISANLNNNCKKAHFVLQIHPKYKNYDLSTTILQTARKLLPQTTTISTCIITSRSQYIEIAGVFAGIKTDIAKSYAITDESSDEESSVIPKDKAPTPEPIQLPKIDQASVIPQIKSYAIVKTDVLDSMAIHALSCLEPVTKECFGTVYADKEGKIVKYHPIDSEEYTLRYQNAVKFTAEFYEHVRRLSKLYEDIGLRLAGDNHSHPDGPPLQSKADKEFNRSFWKTARNTCFITAIWYGRGNKEWKLQKNGFEAVKEIAGKLVKIRAYAGGENTDKMLKII